MARSRPSAPGPQGRAGRRSVPVRSSSIERTSAPGARRLASSYAPREGFADELFEASGRPCEESAALAAALAALGPEQLAAAGRRRDAIFLQQGITFELTGEDGPKERPFPLDLVPRLIPAAEWRTIKRGLAQRIRALNRFVEFAGATAGSSVSLL